MVLNAWSLTTFVAKSLSPPRSPSSQSNQIPSHGSTRISTDQVKGKQNPLESMGSAVDVFSAYSAFSAVNGFKCVVPYYLRCEKRFTAEAAEFAEQPNS